MKTILTRLLPVLLLFSGCGKNNDKPHDYAAEVSGKEFSGTIGLRGLYCSVPFSIQFAAGGQLTFHYFEGSFPGTYSAEPGKDTVHASLNNHTLRFKFSAKDIRAPIALIFPDQPGNNARFSLNEMPLRQVEGSYWQGQYFRCSGGAPGMYDLSFRANNEVLPEPITSFWVTPPKYTRQGASIRYNYTLAGVGKHEFVVVMPDNTLSGIQIAGGAMVGSFVLNRKP